VSRTKVFLVGPMTGIKDFNFPAFDTEAIRLRGLGYDVTSPAELDRGEFGPLFNRSEKGVSADLPASFDLNKTLDRNYALIRESDMVATLPGWSMSNGANKEVFVARNAGIQVSKVEDFRLPAYPITDDEILDVALTYPRGFTKSQAVGMAPPAREHKFQTEKIEPFVKFNPIGFDWLGERNLFRNDGLDDVTIKNHEDPLPTGEVRKVSSTGGEKGSKPWRYDLIPVRPLRALAEHYGRGAEKYSARNYERGYEWSLSYAALQRHLNAFWGGEDLDPETGTHHLSAAAWHCFTLYEFTLKHPDFDDRPK
jgi:hypothetical protein